MEDTKKGSTANATVDSVAETLIDLPAAEEQAGQTKGGPDGQPTCYLQYKLDR